jgi:transposase
MHRYRTAYPPEFRRQMVDLVRSGRTPEELAREFEPTAQSISTWVKQAERDAGKRVDGPTSCRKPSAAYVRWGLRAHRDRIALVKRFVFGLDTRARSSAGTSPVSGNMIATRYVAAHELRFRMPSRSSDRQGWISRVQFFVRSPLRSRFTWASHIGLAR